MDKQFLQNSGVAVKEFDFDYPVISIGSHPDNDIVLPGDTALAFHATLNLQGGQFHLIALGGASSIRVDGAPLAASPARIKEGQRIEIGNYVLSCQQNGSPESVHITLGHLSAAATNAAVASLPPGESPILVNTPVDSLEIDVEQTASYELEIVNAGPIVAAFSVTLSGVPEDWVEISPRMVNLNEGQRARVRISITPPREPASAAGKHPLNAQVMSLNYGGLAVPTDLTLVIRPYYEFMIGTLAPKDQRVSWHKRTGRTQLPISNRGNSLTEFNVSAVDDENGCVFDLLVTPDTPLTRQALVGVPAGGTVALPIQITPNKRRLFAFSAKRYPYTTTVQSPQGTVQMTSGSVSAAPLFGWWSIVLTLLLIGVALFLILQPNIYTFQVAAGKDVIELGDTTRLEWSVSPFATNISISGVDQAINRGQTSLTLAPTQSTTYEIVSGNWLSGLLRIDQRRSLTVLVVPPTPRINVFDVGDTSVAKGQPVLVRWSVTRAEQAFLTIDNVVYELSKEEFSGEREVVLEKDALVTVEAKNGSGSELRSYFVNVVPPEITVRTFTVWVRSESAAAPTPSSGNKLFRPANIPDPNFPEKYVELVPDRNSDSGYRVEFYLPERELSKGEQVMLEWNIDGTDNGKVQIAPFTDPLPARGSQPFFPQESMNFVMTAKSGELEELFMLPVKVFDGTPPTAPKIEFFRASPLKAVGPSDVQFAWSVSGTWTRIQLATEGKVVADYLNPQGFKTIRVTKSATYILTAWNGELSSAAPVEITIDPSLLPVGLYFKSAFPATGRFLINQKVSFTVGFYDPAKSNLTANPPSYVEPATKPTGTVLVSDGVSICTISLPAQTCDLVFTSPGDPKEITASYGGDSVYLSASSDAPYAEYIAVISSTVTITPTYYLLNRTTPADSVLSSPISINTSPLSLDTGIFIRVSVVPQGAPLPSPDAGKVNLYICSQQSTPSGMQITPGSCQPRGFASLTMVGNNGQADIVLESFPNAGTFALLLSYSGTGFVPTDRPEFNVVINPVQIYLSLPTCTVPKNFTGCEIGTSSPAATKVVFDIRKTADDEKILAQLIAPPIGAFEVFEVVGVAETPWSCQMIVVTEGGANYHKLECVADFSSGSGVRSPVNANFRFNNALGANYSMIPNTLASPFQLVIKQNTRISLDSTEFLGLKVGQWVKLTSSTTTNTAAPDGAVILTNAGFQHINANGPITLSATQEGVFGIDLAESNPSNCTVDSLGQVVTISSITTDCAVFFKKAGTFTVNVAFGGDVNFYQSSGATPLSVTVAKQDGITIAWKYFSSPSYIDWGELSAVQPNTDLAIRVELGGPVGFSGHTFSGQNLEIALAITANTNSGTCSVTGTGISGTAPNYLIPISASTLPARADFTLRCDREPMTVSLTASLPSSADFSIASGQLNNRVLGILNRGNSYMDINFLRVNGSTTTLMLTGSAMNLLHIGEMYTLQVTIGRLWADAYCDIFGVFCSVYRPRQAVINKYISDQNKVNVSLDADIYSRINWSKSTCLQGSTANTVQVLMNSYRVVYDFGNPDMNQNGYSDIELYNGTPCVLYFDNPPVAAVTGSHDPTVFSFSVANPNNTSQVFSVTKSFSIPNPVIDRQTVTMTPSATTYNAYVDSANSTLTVDLAPQISGTTLTPLLTASTFPSQFTFSSPCTNLFTGAVTTSTRATLTFSPSAVGTVCNGTLNLTYSQNDWFKSNSANITINIAKHTPSVATIQYLQGQYQDFVATFPTMTTGQSLDMRVRVSNGDSPAIPSLIPTGTVEVWLENSSGVKQGATIYTISLVPGVTYDSDPGDNFYLVTLDSSGYASFKLNFVGAISGASLKYRYVGDSKYNASATSTAGPFDFVAPPPP